MICRRSWLVSPERAARNHERQRLQEAIAQVDHQFRLLCRELGLTQREALALVKEEA